MAKLSSTKNLKYTSPKETTTEEDSLIREEDLMEVIEEETEEVTRTETLMDLKEILEIDLEAASTVVKKVT